MSAQVKPTADRGRGDLYVPSGGKKGQDWEKFIGVYASERFIANGRFVMPAWIDRFVASQADGSELAQLQSRVAALRAMMDQVNAFLADPNISAEAKQIFLGKLTGDRSGDFDDQEIGAVGRIFAAIMANDRDALESMIFDIDGGAFDDALELNEIGGLRQLLNDELQSAGGAPLAGETMSFGGGWRYALSLFSTQEFLDWGAQKGTWFTVPEEFRAAARAAGPEGLQRLTRIEAMMRQVNQFLARSEVTSSEKLEYLARFFGSTSGDFDDADDASTAGRIFAAVMSMDAKAVEKILDQNAIFADDVELDDFDQLLSKLDEETTKWAGDRGIRRAEDEAARSYFEERERKARARASGPESEGATSRTIKEVVEERRRARAQA